MPPLPTQGNLARHGLLIVALAAALGLLATGWSSRRGAQALADTVNQGQAEGFLRAMRERARDLQGRPRSGDFAWFLEAYGGEGLRGIGLVDEDGTLHTQAGTLTNKAVPKRLAPGPYVERVDDMVRVFSPPPRETPGHPRPGPPGDWPPPPGGGPPPWDGPPDGPTSDGPQANGAMFDGPGNGGMFDGPPPLGGHDGPPPLGGRDGPPPLGGRDGPPGAGGRDGRVVLEFEPRLANSLIDRANSAFAIAAFAAAILVAAATLLWRRALREAALATRLAQSERLAALGTMSAVLAHEIKNPLASLKGNAQLVAESLDDGSRPRAQAERVVEAAVRLQTLVANLLDFARGGPIARDAVDPAELLFLAACEAAPKATLALDGAPATFSLDGVRMGQVLENILRNAEQASPDRVSAEMRVEGERLVIVVRDEGSGFSGSPEGFFEPFATTKARGTGLGLAVARRIVELHGGTIVAKTRPEGGAEVRLEIPPGP